MYNLLFIHNDRKTIFKYIVYSYRNHGMYIL